MPLPEIQLIERIRRSAKARNQLVALGIGDDCAILRPPRGHELLVTTDFSIEGTHFRRDWQPSEVVGWRCLARGLSDIAAMGGEPIAAFLSLALTRRTPQKWVDGFLRGFLGLARQYGVELAGGDISESKQGIVADVMVVGSAPRGRAIHRSGARRSDIIYVTGALGAAASELQRLGSLRSQITNYKLQLPRLAVGRYLRERRLATAMMDVSDGLSTDLAHLCAASGVGATLVRDLIPIAGGATLKQALHGGEDYELLFTARKKVPVEIEGVAITELGWIERGRGVRISDGKISRPLKPRGWQHLT